MGRLLPLLLSLLAAVALVSSVRALGVDPVLSASYVSTFEIVDTLPHDPSSFTQGLTFGSDGTLYESQGARRHQCPSAER